MRRRVDAVIQAKNPQKKIKKNVNLMNILSQGQFLQ
jgi:hypothetical protein